MVSKRQAAESKQQPVSSPAAAELDEIAGEGMEDEIEEPLPTGEDLPVVPDNPSALDLYEVCVQSASELVGLLEAIHGGSGKKSPRRLAEDFCGTGAVSVEWVRRREGREECRSAVGCDLDELSLSHLAEKAKRAGVMASRTKAGVKGVRRDVVRGVPPMDAATARADVVFVGNFSIGYIHERKLLVRYLKRSRSRLSTGGVCVVDTYGGESAFFAGTMQRKIPLADGRRVHYTWQQKEADPLTAMVTNCVHFMLQDAEAQGGEISLRIADAFVYHWRLWSVPELRDAFTEAGFRRVEVYGQVPDAKDGEGRVIIEPMKADELDESYAVLVAGRK